ncbi:MAG: hypothetical protein UX62_C0033G0004 [Microgenomates group bacterium GW2011_GWA2_46_7]|nr:MAG: hypothetical protein UX62_C0033G0004 [Microgenomates group bacterium GW2011_GWA2_46_7]
MYRQDGDTLIEVASFCVHGAENNTQDGFFFLAAMRDTIFSRAPAGYNSVVYKHNAVFSIYAPDRNKYLHIGDWNDKGEFECPIKSTGGCINMRKDDFLVLHGGGLYVDPRTGKQAQIPAIEVGMPLVVVQTQSMCTTIGECYEVFGCTGLEQCFKQYTCKLCYDERGVWYYQTYFSEMLRETKLDLSAFDLPK